MLYKKIFIVCGVVILTGVSGVASDVFAQTVNSGLDQAVAKFKNEQSALVRPANLDFAQQQKFVWTAVEVFIQRSLQIQQMIRTQSDVFPPEQTKDLLTRISENLSVLRAYQGAILGTNDSAQLRALVGEITAHRSLVSNEIRRDILIFYVMYFQETTQKKLANRSRAMQEYIYTLRAAGKDTTIIEKIFAPSVSLIEEITTTMHTLLALLKDTEQPVSLNEIEVALQTAQKNISAVYSVFRKITFQEKTILDLNKEEEGIQQTFPEGNL